MHTKSITTFQSCLLFRPGSGIYVSPGSQLYIPDPGRKRKQLAIHLLQKLQFSLVCLSNFPYFLLQVGSWTPHVQCVETIRQGNIMEFLLVMVAVGSLKEVYAKTSKDTFRPFILFCNFFLVLLLFLSSFSW